MRCAAKVQPILVGGEEVGLHPIVSDRKTAEDIPRPILHDRGVMGFTGSAGGNGNRILGGGWWRRLVDDPEAGGTGVATAAVGGGCVAAAAGAVG